LVLERLILTLRIQIRPLALQRFCLTPPALKTRPMGTAALELNQTGKPKHCQWRLCTLQQHHWRLQHRRCDRALFSNTEGETNSAFGWSALHQNTTGVAKHAVGVGSLFSNTTGESNTATGNNALQSNTIWYRQYGNGGRCAFLQPLTESTTRPQALPRCPTTLPAAITRLAALQRSRSIELQRLSAGRRVELQSYCSGAL